MSSTVLFRPQPESAATWAILQIKLKSGTKLVFISGIGRGSVPLVRRLRELKTGLIAT